MPYSTTQLDTIADCDALIAMANVDKEELKFKKYTQDKKLGNSAATASEIDIMIPTALAEISSLTATLAGLTDPAAIKDYQSKLTKAQFKLFTLTERRENFGTLAKLQQEFIVSCVTNDVLEVDVYIAALETRKAEL